MESYVRIGEGFEKSYVPLHRGRRGRKLPKNPYIINEWPLRVYNSGLDMNGTYQVLDNAEDVHLIGGDIRAIERNADVLLNDGNNI